MKHLHSNRFVLPILLITLTLALLASPTVLISATQHSAVDAIAEETNDLTVLSVPQGTQARDATRNLAQGRIIYVDRNATGANNGTLWVDAYTKLQLALEAAAPGDEIWVAKGVYTPTNTSGQDATFALTSGVALYGGFDGSETSRDQRDWETHVTVLSGDIDELADPTDPYGVVTSTTNITGNNAYHVVIGSGTDASAVLDGFTITAGDANQYGGGMFNSGSNPRLANLNFCGNRATTGGGGMVNSSSNPVLINVTFSNNSTSEDGAGLYNNSSNPVLINVTFSNNSASDEGGGMYNNSSSPSLTNVIFHDNYAIVRGGGLYNYNSSPSLINSTFVSNTVSPVYGLGGGVYNGTQSNPTLTNCILWGNTASSGTQIAHYNSSSILSYSLVEGGCPSGSSCDHLLGNNPQFAEDLRLGDTSPAIDAGNTAALPPDTHDLDGDGDTAEPLPYDRAGNPRLTDHPLSDTGAGTAPLVDMGAFERCVLLLDKSAEPGMLEPGERLSYTLAFGNDSTFMVTGVFIADAIPTHLHEPDFVNSGAAITPTGSVSYTWQVEDLAPGAGGIITITGLLSTSLPPGHSFANSATISGVAAGLPVVDTASATVARDGADLAVSKQATHDPVVAGGRLTYTLNLTNHSIFDATYVVLTDTLPGNVTFISASPGCGLVGSSAAVTCSLDLLANQAATAFTIAITAPLTAGPITNTVSVTGAKLDPNLTNNTATESTWISAQADLALVKSDQPDPILAGGLLTYTLAVTNYGPDPAGGVVLSDALPPGVTYAGRLLAWHLNEAEGATFFQDSSGFGHHGSCSQEDETCPQAGVRGLYDYVIHFDGADDWVESTDFDIDNNFGLSLWVHPLSAEDGQAFISKHTAGGNDLFVFGYYNGGYQVTIRNSSYQTGTKTAGAWQHLVVVGKQTGPSTTEVTVYKDSQLLWQHELGAVVGDASGKAWAIGQEWDGGSLSDFFDGAMDEVTIYNLPLSTSEIAALYASHPTFSPIVSQGRCTLGDELTCELGALAPGAVVTAVFPVQLSSTQTGTLTNTASVAGYVPDPVPDNNSDEESTSLGGDLAVSKADAPDPVVAGEGLIYTLTVTNHGYASALVPLESGTAANPTNITIFTATEVNPVSPYPSTIAVSGLAGTVIEATATLYNVNRPLFPDELDILLVGPGGQSVILMSDAGSYFELDNVTLTFDDAAPTPLPNSAQITPGDYQPTDYAGPDGEDSFPSPAPGGPYGAAMSVFDGTEPNGDWSLYVVDDYPVYYTGTIAGGWSLSLWTGSSGTVTDVLPGDVTFVSASPDCDESGGTVTCALGSLDNQATSAFTIAVTAPLSPGLMITNTASVAGILPDLNPADNTATESTRISAADLALGKSAWPDPAAAGALLTYTLVVTNHGPDPAGGVVLTDALPPGVTYTEGTCTLLENDAGLRCELGTLANGAVATVTLPVRVGPTQTGRLTNTAWVSSDVLDPLPGNNSVTRTTAIGAIDLGLSKAVGAAILFEGGEVSYSLSLVNYGPVTATLVAVSDTLPGEITFGGYTATQGAYSATSGAWQVGTLAASHTARLTITGTVKVGTAGQVITNAAVLSASTPADILTHNNTASAAATVAGAGLALSKRVDTGGLAEVPLGSVVTYTIAIENDGAAVASSVVMSDRLPLGLSFGAWVEQGQGVVNVPLQTVEWGPHNVAAHAAYTISFRASLTNSANFAGQILTNTAYATAANADPVSDSASFSTMRGFSVYLPLIIKHS